MIDFLRQKFKGHGMEAWIHNNLSTENFWEIFIVAHMCSTF